MLLFSFIILYLPYFFINQPCMRFVYFINFFKSDLIPSIAFLKISFISNIFIIPLFLSLVLLCGSFAKALNFPLSTA